MTQRTKEKSDLCLECFQCCEVFKVRLHRFPSQRERDFYKIRGLKLIFDDKHNRINETRIINLLDESSLYITKVLDEAESGVTLLDVL